MDLISKKDLINRLIPKYRDGIPDEYDRGANDMLEEVIEAVEEFSAQNKWIPCSERLPEEWESVLACYKSQGGMVQCVTERFKNIIDPSNCWSGMFGRKPIAWQPLPEPYKESEEQ